MGTRTRAHREGLDVPYRKFKLPGGCGTVLTRISDEATIEWFMVWYQSGGQLTADRPPDVDTETLRMWVGPTDAEQAEIFRRYKNDKDKPTAEERRAMTGGTSVEGWPLSTWSCNFDPRVIKVLMTEDTEEDGRQVIRLRIKGVNEQTADIFLNVERVFTADETEEADEAFQEAIEMLSRIAIRFDIEPDWVITLPSDFEATQSEVEAATADFDAIAEQYNYLLPVATFPQDAINEDPT